MVGEAKPEAGRILRQGQRRRISFMHRKDSMSFREVVYA